MDMYNINLVLFDYAYDFPICSEIKNSSKRKSQLLQHGHLLYFRVVPAVKDHNVSVLFQHSLFVFYNRIFPSGNLIIIVYNQNILRHTIFAPYNS